MAAVELQETSRLINYYLDFLASEKAQRAAAYQPTPWELLSPQEQRARALARVQLNEEKRIDNLFAWNSLKREHKNRRREILAELKAKRLNKMSITSNSSAASTPVAETAANSPITNQITPTCTAPFPQPRDQGVANQLEERVNRLKLITIQKKLAPVSVARATEEILVERGSTTATPARATSPSAATIPKTPRNLVPAIAPATTVQDHMDLDQAVQNTPVQNTNPVTTASEAMDVDPEASTSSVDIQLLRKLPEKQVLSKEERIKHLVKEHIHLWKRCTVAQQSGAMEDLKILLHQAQDSQKVLQKLIPRKELEEFVKGWNPWTIKKELFPTAPKKNDGKKRSSSSKGAKELYNDPNRWKMVMRGCNTLEAAYRHMAD
ncbi:uncharacterized protein PGTG_00941 [Puccinia graminis f. sp. tritici CRL 75-36-700-3]|uniref:Uncharacterized protein n=1 Tax=Puccinia graminis f. sp. tritici (strain CRL 75-36-700-3 / race SCCL) TaxID=418459 RepID=E3JU85_PUCGT|nr:uncharacterized protein PGTG_00941 [Puccinia graminis f. sp. tritici CRL 75-36-700-3]EFP75610.2 hypothetical protein PGTG_00941 [Puccinia graminis f. sp. tritici CRL 75-36-700-3]